MAERIEKKNGDRPDTKRSAIDIGRRLLDDWEHAQPDNYFSADVSFQRSLEYLWGREKYKSHASRLYEFGSVLAKEVDDLVREANLDDNLPRLRRYNRRGERIEEVIFPASHHAAGRIIYRSGMMTVYQQPGHNLLSLALFYLSSQNGEAGHNCPLACTAGLIKALQSVGDRSIQEEFLPRLLDPDYDTNYSGAQFLTEIQGGSDVGANATYADPADVSRKIWLLNGEKWFCSNVTADLALVTARVKGQGEGTRGLGLFLVPRILAEGDLNNVYINQLKDKLGTRSLATAELEFRDAFAYQVGPIQDGFKNVMNYVINTSRIYNAIGVCGNGRRAYSVARSYADYRTAFGQPIVHFPIVQHMLANMRATSAAILSGTLHIIKLMDEIELGSHNANTEGFLRIAINLNKYRSAILAHRIIVDAIELLGGNGAVEAFSILPRLLRDNIVYENWEGTHNVLLAQVQRDMRRYKYHESFLASVKEELETIKDELLHRESQNLLEQLSAELDEVLSMDEQTAGIYFRPLMDRLTDLYYVSCLATEGEWELKEKKDRTKMRVAKLFFDRNASKKEPKDIAYYDELVGRLC